MLWRKSSKARKQTTTDAETDDLRKRKAAEWPNELGFSFPEDVLEQRELAVQGSLPEYLHGVLYRVGPGGRSLTTNSGQIFKFDHLFDGLSQIHRFEIVSSTKVLYNSKHNSDDVIEQVRRLGHMGNSFTFGQGRDPCRNYFWKFLSVFIRGPVGESKEEGGEGNAMNVGVNVSTHLPGYENSGMPEEAIYVKTDASAVQAIHARTLEPYGLVDQKVLHPELNGPLSCAHARTDPRTGDVYNYNLDMCENPKYRIFRSVKATGKVEIIAAIAGARPAYVHSFFLTENYVVLCIFGAHFAMGGLKMLYYRTVLDSIMPLDPTIPTRFYVVDRTPANRGVVAMYESEAFFGFHSINAWESGDDVVLEVPTYPNLDCLHKFYFKNLVAAEEGWKWVDKGRFEYTRIRLPAVSSSEKPPFSHKKSFWSRTPPTMPIRQAQIVFRIPWQDSFELPSINPLYITKPHRYSYGVCTRGISTFMDALMKYDSLTHTKKIWEVTGHTPGEPVFVNNPEGKKEDDGVIISVVLDGFRGSSYLLVLDAHTFEEVARVEVEGVVGFGFHGRFVGNVPGAEIEV